MAKNKKTKSQKRKQEIKRKDYIEEAGPETYDVVDSERQITPDAVGSSDVDEEPGDTTDRAGNANVPATIRGHGEGGVTGQEVAPDPDTGGGTTGGGGNQGAETGYDGVTDVGDADPDAGPDIDENTDGSVAGQSGHRGTDEGTS
jgi:hypothetical protein